jgi:hypothetical protein
MATKPTAVQVAAGSKATSSQWNSGAPYTMWRFLDVVKPVCLAINTAAQSIPTGTTPLTAISFDTEAIDTDGQHSTVTNPSRVTIGNTLGWYRCTGTYFNSTNVSGKRIGAAIALNNTALVPETIGYATGTASFSVTVVALVQATLSTDYVELQVFQETGVAANTSFTSPFRCCLLVEYVGTLQ